MLKRFKGLQILIKIMVLMAQKLETASLRAREQAAQIVILLHMMLRWVPHVFVFSLPAALSGRANILLSMLEKQRGQWSAYLPLAERWPWGESTQECLTQESTLLCQHLPEAGGGGAIPIVTALLLQSG